MNRTIISQRISSILGDVQRLSSALYAMNTVDIQRYPENYEVLSTDAAQRAEAITCRLRHLIYATTNVKKRDYLTSAADAQGIEIQQRDGIFEITLPCLIPKRRQQQSREYLIDALMAAMERYFDSHPHRWFRDCVVCFAHIYHKDLPERRVRDYDNLELKQILDAVGVWLLTDDGGLLCDAYQTTELDDKDCTRMFIMEKSRFPAWLAERGMGAKDIAGI